MSHFTDFLYFFSLVFSFIYDVNPGCFIDNLDPFSPLPLVNKTKVYYPESAETKEASLDQEIRHFCPKSTLIVNGHITTTNNIYFICKEGHSEKYPAIEEVACRAPAKSVSIATMKRCNKGSVYDVNFYIMKNEAVNVFTICWNRFYQIPFWTYHRIFGEYTMVNHTSKVNTIIDPQYKVQPSVWNVSNQTQMFYKLLDLRFRAHKFIDPSKGQYLVQKQLTPGEDFFYVSQRNAASRGMNTAPMWKSIRDNNWKSVEYATRIYAMRTKRLINVWTGVYKTLRLPYKFFSSIKQKAFLRYTPDSKRNIYLLREPDTLALAVPAFFWKVLHDPIDKTAIALIVSNNPFIHTLYEAPEIICKDISHLIRMPWIFGDPRNDSYGFFYACDLLTFIANTSIRLEPEPNTIMGKMIWPTAREADLYEKSKTFYDNDKTSEDVPETFDSEDDFEVVKRVMDQQNELKISNETR